MPRGIDTYTRNELEGLLAAMKEPRFRASQLYGWLYKRGASTYDEMSNLPSSLRQRLSLEAPLRAPRLANKQVSADGTRKYVFELADGALVESVGIPSGEAGEEAKAEHLTVCISSQVGCPMGCAFCATGREGFVRNLSPGEMVWQVVQVARDFCQRASGVVLMGQGEPFLNFDNTIEAMRIINDPNALGIGARHITVSTCGIPAGIESLAHAPEQFVLAVSLHAARQEVRDAIMPGCKANPLPTLKQALQNYQAQCGRRISFEYLLIEGINDAQEDFDALLAFAEDLMAHVNLLPMNQVEGSVFQPAASSALARWTAELKAAGVEASVRNSRGSDIDAACGQLKNRM